MTGTQERHLKRSLSLPLLTLYGLGTTIGAGIYALLGEVVGGAGSYAPISFLLASALAGFSAFSFAELAARFPRSAGEALYVREAFGSPNLSLIVGLLVVLAGIASSATIVNGFLGYFGVFIQMPRESVILILVVLLGSLAGWGITQSALTAAAFTVVEAGGLILVIWVAGDSLGELPERVGELVPPLEITVWTGVLAGSFLAFFAFIGFEDMVNVAEEVKDVSRTMPRAIILTLGITFLLYMMLSVVAVLAVDPDEIGVSAAPLALLYERGGGASPKIIGLIGIVAIVNGALIQMIMAARVLYGLASQKLLPAPLARIHPVTRTPLVATVLVTVLVLAFALPLRIGILAEATAAITLTVFALVNLALWRIKRRDTGPAGLVRFPIWVPVAGFLSSTAFLAAEGVRIVSSLL